MKRYNNLLTEDTVTLEFCEGAITEVARGKKKRKKVAHILRNKDIYAYKIRYMLLLTRIGQLHYADSDTIFN